MRCFWYVFWNPIFILSYSASRFGLLTLVNGGWSYWIAQVARDMISLLSFEPPCWNCLEGWAHWASLLLWVFSRSSHGISPAGSQSYYKAAQVSKRWRQKLWALLKGWVLNWSSIIWVQGKGKLSHLSMADWSKNLQLSLICQENIINVSQSIQ